MDWDYQTIRTVTQLLHVHDARYVETYNSGADYFCCECDERHPQPGMVSLVGVLTRPNGKTYKVFDEKGRDLDFIIRTVPATDVSEWGTYGHSIHTDDNKCYLPINYKGKVICPMCVEEAPDSSVYSDIMKTNNLLDSVDDLRKGVRIVLQNGDKFEDQRMRFF